MYSGRGTTTTLVLCRNTRTHTILHIIITGKKGRGIKYDQAESAELKHRNSKGNVCVYTEERFKSDTGWRTKNKNQEYQGKQRTRERESRVDRE